MFVSIAAPGRSIRMSILDSKPIQNKSIKHATVLPMLVHSILVVKHKQC